MKVIFFLWTLMNTEVRIQLRRRNVKWNRLYGLGSQQCIVGHWASFREREGVLSPDDVLWLLVPGLPGDTPALVYPPDPALARVLRLLRVHWAGRRPRLRALHRPVHEPHQDDHQERSLQTSEEHRGYTQHSHRHHANNTDFILIQLYFLTKNLISGSIICVVC